LLDFQVGYIEKFYYILIILNEKTKRNYMNINLGIFVLSIITLIAIIYTEGTRKVLNKLIFDKIIKKDTLLVLPSSILANPTYKVHPLNSREEFKKVYDIDCEAYGESNISADILRNWWKQYPQGIYIVKKSEEVIGAFGIFPLSVKSYNLLREGSITEKEIIINKNENKDKLNKEYWYISGIVIIKKYRKKKAILYLLYISIEHWFRSLPKANNIVIGSIPISEEGLRLLVHYCFAEIKNAEDRKNHYPFYEKTFNKNEIEELIGAFKHVIK
jgi:hypothetical protein